MFNIALLFHVRSAAQT